MRGVRLGYAERVSAASVQKSTAQGKNSVEFSREL